MSSSETPLSRWGERATDWATLVAPFGLPAWQRIAEATGIGPGTRVLDIGCGSGEFCRLAAGRGADVSGIDAAAGMIEVGLRLGPGIDLRVGSMTSLPWDDESFDVVTGFNSFQFAPDVLTALAEARRVALRGGYVSICNWSTAADSELMEVMAAVRMLAPPAVATPPPPTGEPGVVEELARQAGLEPESSGLVDVPFTAPDQATLEQAMLAPGAVIPVIEHAGEPAVRGAIAAAAAPFRRPDGSYRFENRFRYVTTRA
jgi:ubiquinone/menaquinone biosynthesis C-methylase UbiE